jgi:hypothetical protein
VAVVDSVGVVEVAPLSIGGAVGSELGDDCSVDCSAGWLAAVAGLDALVGLDACDAPVLRCDVPVVFAEVDLAWAGFAVLVTWARGERPVPPAWLLVDDELPRLLSPF